MNTNNTNRYTKKIDPKLGDIFTVAEWKKSVRDGYFTNWDGSGYWVKDNLSSDDEVFSTRSLDATHVIWYNK